MCDIVIFFENRKLMVAEDNYNGKFVIILTESADIINTFISASGIDVKKYKEKT